MQRITEVSIEQINQLNEVDFSNLLLRLLHLEYGKFNFTGCKIISVPQKLKVGDGGEDGRIECEDAKDSRWVKNGITLYQCKAYNLTPGNCELEILNGTNLKPQIKEVLDEGGEYVIFMGHDLNKKQIKKRIKSIRSAIKKSGEIYHESAKIEILDSNQIKDWTNQFLSAIVFVLKCNCIEIPLGLQTWNDWSSYLYLNFPFKTNLDLEAKINILKSNVNGDKVTRLIGLSGLGKTRLVFETFRQPEKDVNGRFDAIQKRLSDSVVYFDAADFDCSNILNFTKTYVQAYDALLIVDNCPLEFHLKLTKEVSRMGSRFKLITIDHDLREEQELEPFSTIKIDRSIYKELIHEILKEEFKGKLSDNVIKQIGDYTEGFPQMAVLFAKARLEGEVNLNNSLSESIVKKLIFGREIQDPKEYEVISVCALFTSFILPQRDAYNIYKKSVIEELEQETKLIQEQLCQNITQQDFYRITNKFLTKGILERRGNHIQVKPTPLALKLAVKWWENIPPSGIPKILELLVSNNSLGKRAIDRLGQLDNLSAAKDIVAKMWGPNAPFSQAEVLNTNLGSRLFRSIIVVNPEATLKALLNNYLGKSIAELKEIREGRRNLIWALEKLCFRKETFEGAAKLMMSFAAAEIEDIGNNATNQFFQLFQLYLPGTEANLKSRIKVLSYGLAKEKKEFDKLIIQACGQGLRCGHFNRFGEAERQGTSIPLIDYRPQSQEEVCLYWDEILRVLLGFTKNTNEISVMAENTILDSIRCLFNVGYPNFKIVELLNELSKREDFNWLHALNKLKSTLKYEQLSIDSKDVILKLIENFQPTKIEEIILSTISTPTWHNIEKNEKGERINKSVDNAKLLAHRFVDDGIELIDYLEQILKGEQRQAYTFGYEYGVYGGYKKELFSKAVSVLENIEEKDRNLSFLQGYIAVVDNKKILDNIFEEFLSNKVLRYHSFELVRFIRPTFKDLNKLFRLVENNTEKVIGFKMLEWGGMLNELSTKEVIKLCDRILSYDNLGKWTALGLIDRYVYDNEPRWNSCRKYLITLLENHDFLANTTYSNGILSLNDWSSIITKLLYEDIDHKKFSQAIAKQILEQCKLTEIYRIDTTLENILRLLFEKYFDSVWEIFGIGFLSDDFYTYFNLKNLISKTGSLYTRPILFEFEKNHTKLIDWTSNFVPKAPARLINVAPLATRDENGEIVWHPFTKRMIDDYGEYKEVLNQLSANMGTFSSVGSRVPTYQFRKKLCDELLNHPKDKVRQWAFEKSEYYQKSIFNAQIEDEQRFLE